MRRRPGRSASPGGNDGLFAWTIGILLLGGFALACWIGSFYVFGHPEKALSYGILRKLDKIDPPRRFELTAAPPGEFLDATRLFERFGTLPPRQLEDENSILLRNYLRNYTQTKSLVPYVTGPFNIMACFRLGSGNFFTTGVVALARSTENPAVLLELVFPSAPANVANLERMLLTGLDIKLAKTLDLTAVVDARLLPDGRITITAVPLLYGSYTSSDSTGTFSLEPPADLNVRAGLPVLNLAAVEEAQKHYQAYLERAGLPGMPSPSLMRVQPTEAVGGKVPVARAEPVRPDAAPATIDGVPVARAVPVATPTPTPDAMPVARAIPVNTPAAASTPPAIPVVSVLPTPAPAAALQPFAAATPATIASTAARQWMVYEPGRMPRGRLVDLDTAGTMTSPGDGPTYLAGDFTVSAFGENRAVLRGRSRQKNVRVVVDFPPGMAPPPAGQSFSRDAQRPFQITGVEQAADGTINVYVREVTRP